MLLKKSVVMPFMSHILRKKRKRVKRDGRWNLRVVADDERPEA